MSFLLKHFNGICGYYSFATTLISAQSAQQRGLRVFLYLKDSCFLYPGETIFPLDQYAKSQLELLQDGDVLSINCKGIVYIEYSSASTDNAIVITLACNSNCVMCPVSANAREGSETAKIDGLIEYVHYLPLNIPYMTITGGEPFLLGNDIFQLLSCLKQKYLQTEFQILTNGRAFADEMFLKKYCSTHPTNMSAGIPIHGYNATTHDAITQAPGSFDQTLLGIQHLLAEGERVDIRFVISKLNENNITQMANMILNKIPNVSSVKIMGLEMLGSAAINERKVWIGYEEAFNKSRTAIDVLLQHGIDVELYNFPLCSVPRQYWGIYRKSISDYKIQYFSVCSLCEERENCGGFFSGSMRLVTNVHPIKG